MKLTLAEPKYLRDPISIISELVNEARFKITKNGIELIAMDPANVAMVIFKLFSSCFVDFKLEHEEEIALNLTNLRQILKRAKPNDMLTLELEGTSKLVIRLKSATTRTFKIPIIDIDEKEQRVPELNFAITVKMPSAIFNEAIEDVDVVAESVSLVGEPKKFTIKAEGDLSDVKIELEPGEEVKINTDSEDPVKAKFSIEYLKKMISASKLSNNMILYFNTNYPLKLEYSVMDKVQLSFILAPRVENE